jgi:rhamnogalacturonan endolyase
MHKQKTILRILYLLKTYTGNNCFKQNILKIINQNKKEGIWVRKIYAFVVLISFLLFNIFGNGFVAKGNNIFDPSNYVLFDGTNFEDGSTWGFTPGGGASATVVTDVYGNKYLEAKGSGSGTRSVVKTFISSTTKDKVLIIFDWQPMDVSTSANNSEVLISDENNNPLFRLVKKGGTNGAIVYSVGTTGIDLSKVTYINSIDTDQKWLTVHILFDFSAETVSFEIFNRDDPSKYFSAYNLDLKNIIYLNKIKKISIVGNRASGNTLNFTTNIDNIFIYTSTSDAPIQGTKNIVEIVSSYTYNYDFPLGTSINDVISFFPTTLDVKLENNVVVNNVPVSWSCYNYDPNKEGTYQFIGNLIVDGKTGVKNDYNITAQVNVRLLNLLFIPPQISGYEAVYATDFGDTITVVPKYWGFTTQNATLSINQTDVKGNQTAKLEFTQVNQVGGRVATKNFGSGIMGDKILVKMCWYPGKLNDKGSNLYENGGELRLIDSSGNIFWTLNNTRNSPLKLILGGTVVFDTYFVDPEKWYDIEINCDLINKVISTKIADIESSTVAEFTYSLEGITFDGTLKSMSLVGIRTAGNNITWTTYLDNVWIYNKPIPPNRIINVDKLPYKTIYVNTAQDISQIGLPSKVQVTLANGEKKEVEVARWELLSGQWIPDKQGIYAFKGILKEDNSVDNTYGRYAICYVYNRLQPSKTVRQTEWLNRGLIALKAENGVFVSWRLSADEYKKDIKFNIYRNGQKLNTTPLSVTNYLDVNGQPGDEYKVETLLNGKKIEEAQIKALDKDYISIPLQKPADGVNEIGEKYSYYVFDGGCGDLDGDGEYEIVIMWLPTNAIYSLDYFLTGPTIFDAYKLDGTLLWRINMGLNLPSGSYFNHFLIYDFNGDGKSEFVVKTADGTTVYGATYGKYDENKIIDVVGDPTKNGYYRYGPGTSFAGRIWGGPEYISIFDGATGKLLDSIDYRYSIEKTGVTSWGDAFYNRSDRFLCAVAYLNGTTPSIVYGRGYYARTTFVAYDFVNGKLQERWHFDTQEIGGKGEGMGNHNLSVADVDNDGCDEIIAGSLTLDHDGKILYVMDGEMGREKGSHGDALHVGAFFPDREGIQVFGVHEVPEVASLELHDGATGETLQAYFAYKDTGRGVCANIASEPGYEFWGAGDFNDVNKGAGIYNVYGKIISNNCRAAGLPMNFVIYWDGDLMHELLDDTEIYKYDEQNDKAVLIKTFEGVKSIGGTKATPVLQADLFGDWREEVIYPNVDDNELRIYSTTIPTQYRIYTLMHDSLYRLGIAWQNVCYNQPPHTSFYLGEDIRDVVLSNNLPVKDIFYPNKPRKADEPEEKLFYKSSSESKVDLYFENSKVKITIENDEEIVGGKISVRRLSALNGIQLPSGLDTTSNYVEITKSENIRNLPIRVELGFYPNNLNGCDLNSLKLYKYNNTTAKWEFISGQVIDTAKSIISFIDTEGGIYGIFGTKPAASSGVVTTIILNPQSQTTSSTTGTSSKEQEKTQQGTTQVTQGETQQPKPQSQTSEKNIVTAKIDTNTVTNVQPNSQVKISVPPQAVEGNNPVIKVETLGSYTEKVKVGTTVIEPINISIENGKIQKSIVVEVKIAPETIKNDKVVIGFIFDSMSKKWVPVLTKKNINTVQLELNKAGTVQVVAAKLSEIYSDIKENNWAYNIFNQAITRGIITGYADLTLKPEKQITYYEAAVILDRAFNLEKSSNSNVSEVPQWAKDAIMKMVSNEIFDETNASNGIVSRIEAVKFMVKILEKKGLQIEPEDVKFKDINNAEYTEIVSKAYKLGIVKGYPDGSFKPDKPVTRSEFIAMLIRAIENINK